MKKKNLINWLDWSQKYKQIGLYIYSIGTLYPEQRLKQMGINKADLLSNSYIVQNYCMFVLSELAFYVYAYIYSSTSKKKLITFASKYI